ncbi:glucose-6-phosphate dehydrogenase assembly protein OpcA [Corynebacterium sp.]|uniref:glucose-6-phosphate dehydrogenase assembly protein OpcA n=1 Tax=Corynebacterium sp. TaxID=1720 RepID=UPI0026DF5C56|nr:glucose-6-phosphate dehydrogenase assembly protein OpcA [Corynebacterium sp.]MDO5511943.1 glucose-6-phosphate dehydrogenase assembly protein OpcA [Corynebacterium sp.]
MKIQLPDTHTRRIAASLLEARENNSQTTGRVLTLVVVAAFDDDVDHIINVTRDASHEHPARVLVLLTGDEDEASRLDAEVRVGGHAGASEMVIMRITGEMVNHLAAVVTPLLLPDTPVVAWWPTTAPSNPSEHPLGRLAQRRITNADHPAGRAVLARLRSTYAPGDSDMVWSKITAWRGIVASSLDRHPHEEVEAAVLTGPADEPQIDVAAGWLADRLGVPVSREVCEPGDDERLFPIRSLRFDRASGPVEIEVIDHRTIRVSMPGRPESLVAMHDRSDADCLSEELRHLDPDIAYAHALRGLTRVKGINGHAPSS